MKIQVQFYMVFGPVIASLNVFPHYTLCKKLLEIDFLIYTYSCSTCSWPSCVAAELINNNINDISFRYLDCWFTFRWVSLDPIPWSVSKISKWQSKFKPSTERPWDEHIQISSQRPYLPEDDDTEFNRQDPISKLQLELIPANLQARFNYSSKRLHVSSADRIIWSLWQFLWPWIQTTPHTCSYNLPSPNCVLCAQSSSGRTLSFKLSQQHWEALFLPQP